MRDMFRIRGTDLMIQVPADLDHHTAQRMNRGADRIIEEQNIKRVIYDFRDTEFMDSSGIGAIMGRYRTISLIGGTVLVTHVSARVKNLMHLAGIDKVIRVEEEKRWS